MKLLDLLKGLKILETNIVLDSEMQGVSYDSRRTEKGDLFVAVRGFDTDGHLFISKAVEKGAACVLCEERPESGVPFVLVENTRRALSVVSANLFRQPASELKIIGITGTNGKTTTTYLIKTMLEMLFGAKVGLIGTNRNMIGETAIETERTTPESFELQRLFRKMADAGCTHIVMEVSSHALFLDRVYGVPFDIGVFTNLTRDHMDFHKTMEAYAKSKSILFENCRIGIINMDSQWAETMIGAAKCPVYTYSSEKDEADLTAKNISLLSDGVSFAALTRGRLEKVRLGIPGMFSVYNALSALAVLINSGADIADAAEALSRCSGVTGRAEVVPTGGDFTVIIDYAHTPDAVENIIKTVRGFAEGRVVTLIGCGGDRDKTKRPIMGAVAASLSDYVIVTSDNPRTESPRSIIEDILTGMSDTSTPYTVIENRKEAIGWAIRNALPKDVIILAGKGHETYQTIGKEKHHFDEREIVREFFRERQSEAEDTKA